MVVVLKIILHLFHTDGDVRGDVEAVPLVIDGDDLAGDGVARLVAEFAEQCAVEPPFQGHGVLGLDQVGVLRIATDPLSVDFDLRAGDVKYYAVVITSFKCYGAGGADASRKVCRHQIFLEEAGRIHQNQRLVLSIEPDMVSEVC